MSLLAVAVLSTLSAAAAQQPFDRLPADRFDVRPPSAAVSGSPGDLHIRAAACRSLPLAGTRQRIVDLATQEWAFFGFSVVDRMRESERRYDWRRWRNVAPAEGKRVASSIAGYWAATPEGSWMVERQNDRWSGPEGFARRWRDPWSAAFISWVMCEAGLGAREQFRRAIAHHVYVDQAIRSRDAESSAAAFVARDPGEAALEPGDLLCSSRRNAYRSVRDRRGHLGVRARMHCDIVVQVEPDRGRILAIGGNVRGTVSLKMLPGSQRGEHFAPSERIFAHLQLRADPVGADALDQSPTLHAIRCVPGTPVPPALVTLGAAVRDTPTRTC